MANDLIQNSTSGRSLEATGMAKVQRCRRARLDPSFPAGGRILLLETTHNATEKVSIESLILLLAIGTLRFFLVESFEGRFPAKEMMVVLSKAVGLVTDILEQPQCERFPSESDRFFFAGAENFLLFFGK